MSSKMKQTRSVPRYVVSKHPGKPAHVVEIRVGEFEFEDMQKLVGGYVEPLQLAKGAVLWMHDGGRHVRLPVNVIIPGTHHPIAVFGPIVITDSFRSTIRGFDAQAAECWRVLADAHQGSVEQMRVALDAERAWLSEVAARFPDAIVIEPPEMD